MTKQYPKHKKTGPEGPAFPFSPIASLRSEILVRGRRRFVHCILRGFLGVAHSLLALALYFLDHAFALQTIGTGGFTDALLGLADRFVGGTLDLVCGRTHRNTPSRLIVRRGN